MTSSGYQALPLEPSSGDPEFEHTTPPPPDNPKATPAPDPQEDPKIPTLPPNNTNQIEPLPFIAAVASPTYEAIPEENAEPTTKPRTNYSDRYLVKVSASHMRPEEIEHEGLQSGDLYLARISEASEDILIITKMDPTLEEKNCPKNMLEQVNFEDLTQNQKIELHLQALQAYNVDLLEIFLFKGYLSSKFYEPSGDTFYHLAAEFAEPVVFDYLIRNYTLFDTQCDPLSAFQTQTGFTLLHSAAYAGRSENIEVILEQLCFAETPEVLEFLNARNYSGNTALALAILRKEVKSAILLIGCDKVRIDIANNKGDTLFHLAARIDDIEIIGQLIYRYNVNEDRDENNENLLDESKNDPLSGIVAKSGKNENNEILINELKKETQSGVVAIALSRSEEIIKSLLPYYEIDAAVYSHSCTLLHIAASTNNIILGGIILEASRINMSSVNNQGLTPLMLACKYGNVEMVQLLLSEGADPNLAIFNTQLTRMVPETSASPLEIASMHGKLNCVKLLLDHNVSLEPSQKGNTAEIGAIHAACFAGMDHIVDYFLKDKYVDCDQFNTSGFTPLYYAIRGRHTSTTQLLINAGADPSINLPTKLTQEALLKVLNLNHAFKLDAPTSLIHLTIHDNNVDLLTLLVSTDAVEDIKDNIGLASPLSLAIKLDRVELLHFLLKPATDILDIGSKYGSALHIACHYGSVNSLHYILSQVGTQDKSTLQQQIFEHKISLNPDTPLVEATAFEMALNNKNETLINILLDTQTDSDYFIKNMDKMHFLINNKLFSSLRIAMDTMIKTQGDTVTLHSSFLDSNNTGSLPIDNTDDINDKSLLHKIKDCPYHDIVYHPTVSSVLEIKINIYRLFFIISALFYIIFLFLLGLAFTLASYTCDSDLFNYRNPTHVGRLFCEILSGILFFIYFGNEVLNFLVEWDPIRHSRKTTNLNKSKDSIIQRITFAVETTSKYKIIKFLHFYTKNIFYITAKSFKTVNISSRGLLTALKKYLSNPFRILTMGGLCFLMLFYILRLSQANSQWAIAAISYFFFTLSLLEYSKIFPSFYSYVLRIFMICVREFPRFILLTSIFIIAFVISGHLFLRQGSYQSVGANSRENNSCSPEFLYFNDFYADTNRLFVSSMSFLVGSGLCHIEDKFTFSSYNWTFELFILLFSLLFVLLLVNILIAQVLYGYSQFQGSLSYQRCLMDIVYRAEMHSSIAFLFGSKIRLTTCVHTQIISTTKFDAFIDKLNQEKESSLLMEIKTKADDILLMNQKQLHMNFSQKTLLDTGGPANYNIKTKKLSQTVSPHNMTEFMEELRKDLREAYSQNTMNLNSVYQKVDDLEEKISSIYNFLTGVSVEIV